MKLKAARPSLAHCSGMQKSFLATMSAFSCPQYTSHDGSHLLSTLRSNHLPSASQALHAQAPARSSSSRDRASLPTTVASSPSLPSRSAALRISLSLNTNETPRKARETSLPRGANAALLALDANPLLAADERVALVPALLRVNHARKLRHLPQPTAHQCAIHRDLELRELTVELVAHARRCQYRWRTRCDECTRRWGLEPDSRRRTLLNTSVAYSRDNT